MSSPLIDAAKRVEQWVENNLADPQKNAGKKVDPSWHAQKVAEANESFRQVGKKPVAKPVKKRTAPLANKRVPRKKAN